MSSINKNNVRKADTVAKRFLGRWKITEISLEKCCPRTNLPKSAGTFIKVESYWARGPLPTPVARKIISLAAPLNVYNFYRLPSFTRNGAGLWLGSNNKIRSFTPSFLKNRYKYETLHRIEPTHPWQFTRVLSLDEINPRVRALRDQVLITHLALAYVPDKHRQEKWPQVVRDTFKLSSVRHEPSAVERDLLVLETLRSWIGDGPNAELAHRDLVLKFDEGRENWEENFLPTIKKIGLTSNKYILSLGRLSINRLESAPAFG